MKPLQPRDQVGRFSSYRRPEPEVQLADMPWACRVLERLRGNPGQADRVNADDIIRAVGIDPGACRTCRTNSTEGVEHDCEMELDDMMENLGSKAAVGLALGAALVGGLAGCSRGSAPDDAAASPSASESSITQVVDDPTPEISATAAPSATPETTAPAPEPVAAGTVLTPSQAANLPEDTTAWAMADGTQVAVVDGQPVPETVTADIGAKAVAAFPGGPVQAADDDLAFAQQQHAFDNWLNQVGHDLGGRAVVGVVKSDHYNAGTSVEFGVNAWIVAGARLGHAFGSREDATAAAQAYVEKMGPAYTYIVAE